MLRVSLVLVCLTWTSHGRRVHGSSQNYKRSPKTVLASQSNKQAESAGFAKFLLASNPTGAFSPSSFGARASSPMASSRRFGHHAPKMGPLRASSIEFSEEVGHMDNAMIDEHGSGVDLANAEELVDQIDPATIALGLAVMTAMHPAEALAKGGEFGIFEGRIVSLAHPFVMALVYAASAFSAYTGYSWRRLRELGGELTELKSQRKALEAKLDPEDESPAHAKIKAEVASLTTKIDEITATRKEMAGQDFRDKHWLGGSLVLGLGVSFAIEGPVNTFLRAQKLFPGPHLYAGAGLVVCWALAASLVGSMQKGKDWARNAHIAINVLALGLFTWQIPTGWEITQKVIKFTKFP